MSIYVDGDNNRTAGRDYFEVKPEVCPSCEIRFLTGERQWCRHCEDEYNRQCQIEASQKRKNKIIINIFIFIFVIIGISWLLQEFASEPISKYASYTFFCSLILAAVFARSLP